MSNSKLYVGNMSFNTTESELRSAFEQFGSVTDVYVAMDKMTGRPRGFAFVTMGTADEAKAATEKLNGTDLGGRGETGASAGQGRGKNRAETAPQSRPRRTRGSLTSPAPHKIYLANLPDLCVFRALVSESVR